MPGQIGRIGVSTGPLHDINGPRMSASINHAAVYNMAGPPTGTPGAVRLQRRSERHPGLRRGAHRRGLRGRRWRSRTRRRPSASTASTSASGACRPTPPTTPSAARLHRQLAEVGCASSSSAAASPSSPCPPPAWARSTPRPRRRHQLAGRRGRGQLPLPRQRRPPTQPDRRRTAATRSTSPRRSRRGRRPTSPTRPRVSTSTCTSPRTTTARSDPGADNCDTAEAHLKDTTVTLPEGLVVNPSGANGLDGCSQARVRLHLNRPRRHDPHHARPRQLPRRLQGRHGRGRHARCSTTR